MAKRIRFCPRCMNIIRKNDEKCSSCGLLVEDMQKAEEERLAKQEALFDAAVEERERETENKVSKNRKKENDKDVDNSTSESKSDSLQGISEERVEDEVVDKADNTEGEKTQPKRHKHKKKKQPRPEDLPQYTVDAEGNFDIDTKDVSFLEGVEKQTYSVKKARGDAPVIEKIKWWEIYKWADRILARRKVMKEVNKASRKIPYGINKVNMMILCLLFGWMGAHNFYAKNLKKGFTVLIFDVIVGVVAAVPALYKIMGIFVGGGLAFCVTMMWILDIIDLILNRYKYRISKEEFISNLNIKTRAKLGKKYISLDKTVFKAKEQKRIDKINKKLDKKNKHKKEKISYEK